MYQILEHAARTGSPRVVCETSSREACARFFVALIQRSTLTVHTVRGEFVERSALAVVMHALDPRVSSPASFTADGPNGSRFVARFLAPVKPAPNGSGPDGLPGYPRGSINLGSMTRAPHDKRAAMPSEAARAW